MKTETIRLVLREFTATDIDSLYALESKPEVVRYQEWEPMNEERAAEYVRSVIEAQSKTPRPFYDLAVELKDSKQFLGRVGLKINSENLKADLWFSFLPQAQGQGFALEAVRGMIFSFPELHTLEIECDPRNQGSRNLAARLGFEQTHYEEKAYECKGEWVGSIVFAKILKRS